MADVRCQMCGKPNPPELDECKFCGARLKPVVSSASIDRGPGEPAAEVVRQDPVESGDRSGNLAAEELLRSEVGQDWTDSSPDVESSAIPIESAVLGGVEGLPDRPIDPGKDDSTAAEIPDWLTDLRDEETVEAAPESETENASPELSGGDWIARLDNEVKGEGPEPNKDREVVPGESVGSDADASVQFPEMTAANNLPEWLYDLQPASPESEEEKPVAVQSMPDLPEQTESDLPVASAGSIQDWLSKLDSEPGQGSKPAQEQPQAESRLEDESSYGYPGLEQSVEKPEEVKEKEEESGPASTLSPEAERDEPRPDWLDGIERAGPSAAVGSPVDKSETAPFATIPDWLSELKPEKGEGTTVKREEPQMVSGALEAADLPSWVQAMRPVESVIADAMDASDEEMRVTEQSGPLAGLRGVLPSKPGLGPIRRPSAYAGELKVSEGQRRYAVSLENLVAGEAKPRTSSPARPASGRVWLGWIAALLILAIGIPFIFAARIAPATSILPLDGGAAATLIDGLPADVPVLVAFDYDPALFGELEATAAPFLERLLEKGTPLALISTSPTGPALAEQMMQTLSAMYASQHPEGEQYVDLGYLAGGPAGMSYFAFNPRIAMPRMADGNPAWENGILSDIRALGDFAAFIVLTDNSDTARNWIEQAGSGLGDSPMIMIVSAQAGPVIRPYLDSGQLGGLISGLTDATLAEQAYSRPGLASQYWSSYRAGLLVIVLLITVGAFGAALTGSGRSSRKNLEGEG